ncbi:MAG: hypothetical protein ACRD0B_00195 [Acidimicrobiales bacterium]
MTPLRCAYCGRRPVEMHHVTGRLAPGGLYLDPGLVIPLCRRHHSREHEVLLRQGLAFVGSADPLGHRLARLLDLLGRLADHGRPLMLEGPALYALVELLGEAADDAAAREAAAR